MRIHRRLISLLVLPVCLSFNLQAATASTSHSSAAAVSNTSPDDEEQMIQPSDFFQDFPVITWEMKFQDARRAIEKTGAQPVGFKKAQTELAWDGTFGGMSGRATVLFREGDAGLYEIAVIVYAMEKRRELFEQWTKRIVAKHGEPKQVEDTSIDTSKVWRFKNGIALELRLLKDDDSPVLDIHWVKTTGDASTPNN